MRTILRPTWIVDGTGAGAYRDHAVVLRGELIEAVVPVAQLAELPGDRAVDLTGTTLIPGLINNHVHLVLPGDNTPFVPWIDTQSDAALALRASANAARSLRAGVTTVRDCGARGTTVLDLRSAQSTGLVGGARIVSCGWPLTITGGHTRHFGGEADGTDGLRRMVRHAVSAGADYVKVMASGGGTPGSLPEAPSYSVDELRAIVEIAHDLGRPVAMHCIATESIARAVEAGADLIEHAMFFGRDLTPRYDPAVAERLARAAIPVTPTLQVNRDLVDLLPNGKERELWLLRQEEHRTIVSRLRALGVPLLAGSDAGWRATAFDTFWKELDELVACGLSPVDAIHAATGATSKALGVEDRYGTIRPGLLADLVAVNGDLANDIACLQQVRAVYQGGVGIATSR
jgi:imidazolonepropionase-like amidohydrolase